MTYRSPVADILFSLKAVAGLPELIGGKLDGEFDWDTIASVVSEAGRFATEEIAPLNRTADTVGARLRERRRDHAAGLRRRLSPLGRGRLGRRVGAGRIRRHGAAASRQRRLHRDLERRLDGLRALPAADRGRDRRAQDLRLARAARHLSRGDGFRPLDRHDEPDRAAGRLRPQRGQDPRRARRGRDLPPVRPEDLHHLRRARHGREHRPSRARPPARRARRHARAVAVPRAEIPGQAGRDARARATTCAAPASSTSSASTARRPA